MRESNKVWRAKDVIIRAAFLMPTLCWVVLAGPIVSVVASPFDLSEAYEACLSVPDYALGGAMAGDCMNDQSTELDLEIETVLARESKKYCVEDDRDAIAESQWAWFDYRESYCTLIANSPGNTGAWINAGACRLDLTQKRLEDLTYLTDHAYTWCREMQFLMTFSHFGDPTGLARHDKETGALWSTREDVIRHHHVTPPAIDISMTYRADRHPNHAPIHTLATQCISYAAALALRALLAIKS